MLSPQLATSPSPPATVLVASQRPLSSQRFRNLADLCSPEDGDDERSREVVQLQPNWSMQQQTVLRCDATPLSTSSHPRIRSALFTRTLDLLHVCIIISSPRKPTKGDLFVVALTIRMISGFCGFPIFCYLKMYQVFNDNVNLPWPTESLKGKINLPPICVQSESNW